MPEKKSLHILIIEESRTLCSELSDFLLAEGHSVSCVHSGKIGLEAVRQEKPDLIVLDVVLPGLSGYELIQRLERLAETRHIPIIVVSAHLDLEYELLTIFDFIPKPADLERLGADIELLKAGGKKRGALTAGTLAGGDYQLFYDYLILHSGLHFERRNLKILERGVLNRMRVLKISTYLDYFNYLSRFHESRQELQKLLQFLTVGETYFFRYGAHFEALRTTVIPELIRRKGEKRLRIWSAGCSTGEEPYSLAMTIMEALPDWQEWDIKVFATDINNRALNRSRDGVYSARALRVTEQHYLDRYFDRIGESYLVRDEVKRLVVFSHLNLQTAQFPDRDGELSELDAIFCRNVMIYFSIATTRKIVEKFAATFHPGGYLFLGHAETMIQISTSFERISQCGGFYYRQKIGQEISRKQPAIPVKERNPAGSGTARLLQTRHAPLPPQRPVPPPVAAVQSVDDEELYRSAQRLFDAEDFGLAAQLLFKVLRQNPWHLGALVMQGFILANAGHFQDALAVCGDALAVDDLFADAYFLKGLVLEMSDRSMESVGEYQRAILLNMDFVMSHYNLGKLYFRLGRDREGVRELKNSLKLLEKCREEIIIPFSGGLSREVFLGLVSSELAKVA